jgi:hypothetical protein
LTLLAGAFAAPLFMFPYGVATMAFVVGLSETTRMNIAKRIEETNGTAKDYDRHPEL